MTPGDIVALLLVGLIAGWLAGVVMKGKGFGLLANIVLGIIGAVVGGFLFGLIGISAYGFLGRIVVAFAGSVVLIGLSRMISGRAARARP